MRFCPTTPLLLPWLAIAFAETGNGAKPCHGVVCQAGEEESAALLQAKVREHRASPLWRSSNASFAQKKASRVGSSDQTDITAKLNGELENGVVVRVPDFLSSSTYPKPAAVWRSDIYPPNQMYMSPDYPFGAVPIVGYAMDNGKWDDVVLDTFYPHDANACDAVPGPPDTPDPPIVLGRCGWTGENWECPGAWVAKDTNSIQYDTSAIGAANYKCRGCHFDKKDTFNPDDVDQQFWHVNQDFDVVDPDTGFCNCPSNIDYSDRDAVCEWVEQTLITTGKMKNPSWALDSITCWVDDLVPLSNIQNCYYWKYYENLGSFDAAPSEYWGWNEIGTAAAIDDASSWTSLLIYLPAQLSGMGLGDLSADTQDQVEKQLDAIGDQGLQPGADHMTERPGSYVVMANENQDENANWNHYFFCQSWKWKKYQVCFLAQEDDPNGNGYCYLEYASTPCLGSPSPPAPAPAPSTDCMTWPGINPDANPIYDASCQPDGGACCFNNGQSPCRYCNSETCYGQGACEAP